MKKEAAGALGPITVAPRKSLVTHVEEALRQALIEGRLQPGARLVTRELAESLGTSITPVREALVRFAASGVLTAEPSQSFRVPRLTGEQYSEIAEVRKSVEGLAASKAAERIAADDIELMTTLLEQYLAARSADDSHLALRLNKEFRFVLYRAANMPTLLGLIEMLWLMAGPGFNYLFVGERPPPIEHRNYDDLLNALRSRQPLEASIAIHRAIDDGAARVLDAIAKRDGSNSPA
ncbi:FCD domain-containing protein [Jiella avicenniae]|uniref:GntR family transcriptional regulator n=1 Tax=Jiella avicenniae TaxID=2907202 RepID=A0A9X1P3Z5_9HYPH|nr:FCD domain-containing protein [Jiella avicenniae]MCE7029329.1 GntR family transcriptional regulator [Jiella avicenniae]